MRRNYQNVHEMLQLQYTYCFGIVAALVLLPACVLIIGFGDFLEDIVSGCQRDPCLESDIDINNNGICL